MKNLDVIDKIKFTEIEANFICNERYFKEIMIYFFNLKLIRIFDNISSTFYLNINLGVTSYDLYVPPKNILQMLASIWKNKMLLPIGYSFKFNEETKIKCKKLFIN